MRIGINTRFLLPTKMEGFGWYTYEVVKRMVLQHPEHEFVFFFDRAFDPKFVFAPNVTPVVLFPPARHPFLFIWWFGWSIKKALKKYRIDVFFSPDGYLSLETTVPQINVIHDLNFEHHPEDIPAVPRWYLCKYFPKFAKKSAHILTVSHFSKADIVETYGIPEDKITVAWNGASEAFHPISEVQKSAIRDSISGGKPYFIFVGAIHPRKNVRTLLNAFEQFASENTTVNLLIVGENLWRSSATGIPSVSESIRERIHFTGHVSLEQLTEYMGAAHALVYIPYFEGFGIPLVEAMRCGVPIIAGNLTCLPEVAGDAAVYVDPFDLKEIVAQLHVFAENTSFVRQLSEKSLKRSTLFSWEYSSQIAWEVIETIYHQSRKT